MEKNDREFIAESIRVAANNLRAEADRLVLLSERLVDLDDIGYVNEAVSTLTNLPSAARLDVIISRLIRVTTRA